MKKIITLSFIFNIKRLNLNRSTKSIILIKYIIKLLVEILLIYLRILKLISS